MKLRFLAVFLIAALLMAYGCGSDSNLSKINGAWKIDIEKTMASSEEINAQLAAEPLAVEMLKAILADTYITIDAEKNVFGGKMLGAEIPETKFSVVSEEGNQIKLKSESGDEVNITIIDDNAISMDDPSGIKVIFTRKEA
ncbi:MAG: hypothetical protein IJD04_07650 [Desulfovibrionaceae bacterium]|nr:hypothetical protein [Desulfovibrionaceae bacterium]